MLCIATKLSIITVIMLLAGLQNDTGDVPNM